MLLSCNLKLLMKGSSFNTDRDAYTSPEMEIGWFLDEAMTAQQQLARSEVTVTMLREERQLLKDTEQRLMLERDALVSEKRHQNLLHVNLENIKLNLERNDNEIKTRLENAVASCEEQSRQLRQQLDTAEDRHGQALKSLQERLQLEHATALKAAEERTLRAEGCVTQLQQQLESAEARARLTSPLLRRLSPIKAATDGANEADRTNELRTELAESRTALEEARQQLEGICAEAQLSRDRATKLEEELKRSSTEAAASQKELQQQIAKCTSERDTAVLNLEQARDKLKVNNRSISFTFRVLRSSLATRNIFIEIQ